MGRRDEHEEDEEELELVLFQGAVNGVDANLKDNQRLVQAGLVPAKKSQTEVGHWEYAVSTAPSEL